MTNSSPLNSRQAMADDHAQLALPTLMSSSIRRFGRYEDFKEFGHLSSSGDATAGSKSVGKITIDCQFLFKQSQWGVLGDRAFPAGVLYLNLNFGRLQSCRLKSAAVTITLDDEDPCLETYRRRFSRGQIYVPYCPIHITDWYGPKKTLLGEERIVDKRFARRMMPEFNFMDIGVGGLGFESETSFQQSRRWSFNGQLLPGKGTWEHKSLRWDMVENDLERQPTHSSRMYTAFAFEHSGQPFLMKVDVEGRLDRWDKQVKSKLKFGGGSAKGSRIVTLIDFGDSSRFRKRLDEIAKGLPRAMEMKNFEEIPVVIPNPMSGATAFQTVTTPHIQPEGQLETPIPAASATTDRVSSAISHSTTLQGNPQSPHSLLSEDTMPATHQRRLFSSEEDSTAPTVENLTRVARARFNPRHEDTTESPSPAARAVAETIPGGKEGGEDDAAKTNQMPTTQGEDWETREKPESSTAALESPRNDPDAETVAKILQIPAMLLILRMFVMEISGHLLPPADTKMPKYLAGLWSSDPTEFALSLLWQPTEPRPRPAVYAAPSWPR
ncbi:hypothetical protein B0T25DRAFT_636264 [Lasiosphaeria hispida]|uniref:Uncharacterized protein n=1 Tax=Lasiosphaeria hispida TaxID=260671 RepID=A0AAJ0M7M2_9PEZI|nr:hypothetical protein B0T25DRAFT_636264 [Lasiosphaeria hispida]